MLHILVVGDSNVGKSTLIDALCCGKSPLEGDIRSILGPSMYSACGQRHVRMLYWDQYAPMEARVDLILGCFAADSPLSIRGLSGQLACMMIHRQKGVDHRGPPLLLVQCKADLAPALHVATLEAARAAIPDPGLGDGAGLRMTLSSSGRRGAGVLDVARAIVAGVLERQADELIQREHGSLLHPCHRELAELESNERRESMVRQGWRLAEDGNPPPRSMQMIERIETRPPWEEHVGVYALLAVQQSQDAKLGWAESGRLMSAEVSQAAVQRAYKTIGRNGVRAEMDLRERNRFFGSQVGSAIEYQAFKATRLSVPAGREPTRVYPAAAPSLSEPVVASVKDRMRAVRRASALPADAWAGNLGLHVSPGVLGEDSLRHFVRRSFHERTMPIALGYPPG